MFCYQCQEAAKNTGCDKFGVCGKNEETSNLQDLLIFVLKGLAIYSEKAKLKGSELKALGQFAIESLFATITNANFDDKAITERIQKGLKLKENLKKKAEKIEGSLPEAAAWTSEKTSDFSEKSKSVGVLSTENEDVRSLRELLIYGVKGIAAYAHHAYVLGCEKDEIYSFVFEALAATTQDLSADELVALNLKCGSVGATTMALLDEANTSTYGHPELTKVNIGVGGNPGILISGHDLKDMDTLLKQTEGTGIDVYTHSEMLPAHYYPAFKKCKHFVGNYGNAWWKQSEEFEKFNGPILMTTNCITPVKDSYKGRIFTTGAAGFPGVKHISAGADGSKDFSELIEIAKKSKSPVEIETGEIVGGFAHNQVLALADKVVEAVKAGAITRFVVMAGCDGRQGGREYFTDVAKALPKSTIILTAGCAKYRYNKLELGDIGGIPRVLDAGQCNDCYSLAVIALKLKEVFGLDDVNKLPLSMDIAWYEQKAVIVLLALLALGFKGMRLGPTLPAFLSPNVAKVLVEKFEIKPTSGVQEDIDDMLGIQTTASS